MSRKKVVAFFIHSTMLLKYGITNVISFTGGLCISTGNILIFVATNGRNVGQMVCGTAGQVQALACELPGRMLQQHGRAASAVDAAVLPA